MDVKKRKLDENGSGLPLGPSPALVAPPPAPPVASSAAPAPAASPPRLPNELSRDDARFMIDPLSNEQLVELAIHATLCHYDILEEVRKFADKDPVHRKIFVRGLGWDTHTETLKGVFSQFGELEEGIVIFDKNTGKSRGYGFVTFRHMDGALNALKEPSKRIDGRMTVCQLASTGPTAAQPPQDIGSRKIYVGNVPMEWPADRLLNVFGQYGEIEEGPLGFDKQTGRSRGFALFIYKSADAAKRSLEEPVKLLDGHQLFCKLAVEGLKQKFGGIQGQPDMSELTMPQTEGAASVPSMQYGAAPQGMINSGVPYSQNANPPLNPSLNPALTPTMNPTMQPTYSAPNQNYAIANPPPLNTSLPSSMNPSYPQVMNPGASQAQTSLGMPSYGSHYGPQTSAYGGQPAAYPGVGAPATMYNVAPASMAPQTPVLQGHGQQYVMPSYQNQQQVAASSAPRAQQTGTVPSMPYYGM